MKLQTQNNIYNITYSGIILVIICFFLLFTLTRIYYKQIDDSIITEREIIEEEIEYLDTVPDYSTIFGHQIEVSILQKPLKSKNIFQNLKQYDERTQTEIVYRNNYFSKNRKNGLGYSISINKPLSELLKFKRVVIIAISLAFLLLLLAFLGMGYFVNRRLWRPFYKTIDDLNHFNLEAPVILNFSETKINEFKQLNENISSLSQKLKSDYIQMKEFTENLSHEINTMLAIIVSKVELLLQQEDLNEEQVDHFKTIYHVSNNLSHLNNGLLLLAKIDNQYYSSVEKIEFIPIITKHLETFDDFIRQKNLNIETRLNPVSIVINKPLINILVSNMIINSIKHNQQDGFIRITLTENSLCIVNSGNIPTNHPSETIEEVQFNFKPFKSLGLGLEIIKRICRIYNFGMNYSAENEVHKIEIIFNH
jgi:two-component system, OmpR family, sensor histidine kinase QseC